MFHINIFIELIRLKKPIGFMLLFWPCSWGLAYSYNFNNDYYIFIKFLILFFLGSVLMRSAGCIVNDIVDKNIDKKVSRTKKRPLAAGKISIVQSLLYVVFLCSLAFLILIQFNQITILLGLGSMVLAFTYPFMKRITYWPQLFLGLTFNWGVIMASTAINNDFTQNIFVLYLSAIFWTLGYDSIYGAQDIKDDEIIGVKSTSIRFKKKLKLFVSTCYFISSMVLILLFSSSLGLNLFSFFLMLFILSLLFQIIIFNLKKPQSCLQSFKINNYSGLFLFLGIFFNGISNGI